MPKLNIPLDSPHYPCLTTYWVVDSNLKVTGYKVNKYRSDAEVQRILPGTLFVGRGVGSCSAEGFVQIEKKKRDS